MRRTVTTTALVLVAMLFVGVQPALATRLVEEIPGHKQLDLSPFCGVPDPTDPTVLTDLLDQRDPRTLTTWMDARGRTVLQTLKTGTTDVFTGADGDGVAATAMDLVERSVVAVRPDPNGGEASILWVGQGAIWGDDKAAGGPFLLWVTGVVLMKGSYDPKTGIFAVSSKTVVGQQTDLCEAIDEGLKPRH